jgi:hypothetical protein
MCEDDLTLPMLLAPRLLLAWLLETCGPCGERQSASVERRTMEFVLKARRAPTLTTAAANRCGGCSDVDERTIADQSTPKSKGRRRRKAELLPFGAEEGPAPRYDDDNADGDVRSPSRKDARKHQSPDLYATMPRSSAKS